ncbi:hypothetical protein ACFL21_01725 [Patescibacteria group bacterium]
MSTKLDSQNFEGDLEVFRDLIVELDSENELDRVFGSEAELGEMRIEQVKKMYGVLEMAQEDTDDLKKLRYIRNSIYELISGLNIFLSQLGFVDSAKQILGDGELVMEELNSLHKSVREKMNTVIDKQKLEIEKCNSESLDVNIVQLGTTIVPTSGFFFPENKSGGKFFERKKYMARLTLVLEVLGEIGIKKCMIFEGSNEPSMIRRMSYNVVVIPELNRVILVCEEKGNRTFIRKGIADLPSFFGATKQELKEDPNVISFCLRRPDRWRELLKRNLVEDYKREIQKVDDENDLQGFDEFPPRDFDYYSNKKIIRDDITTFAGQLGVNPVEISSSFKFAGATIQCSNGEDLKFARYCRHAGVALGIARTSNEASGKFVYIISMLLKIAGYPKRDCEYYRNSKNVSNDLINYAQAAGLNNPLELGPEYKFRQISINCSNGEQVIFEIYLVHASKQLGLVEKDFTKKSSILKTLHELLSIAGYEIVETVSRDVNYYSDPMKVKADLLNFVKEFELETPFDISGAPSFLKSEVVCTNGEKIKFSKYLCHAALALGFAETYIEAKKNHSKILKRLLEIAGYGERDEEYYNCSEKVRVDLEKYARFAGLNSPLELNMGNRKIIIECSNGELVRFKNYLYGAGNCLNVSPQTKILKELLKIVGYEVPSFIPRDQVYYNDSDIVRTDLQSFADQFRESPFNLSTSPKYADTPIICSNGEELRFERYLVHAGLALGMANSHDEAHVISAKIRHKLMEIAGFQERDVEYYRSRNNVRSDLLNFAKAAGFDSPLRLTTGARFYSLQIECSNGEEIYFIPYLSQAGITLGIVQNSRDGYGLKSKIFKELLKIAGFERRDNIYYTNRDNVRSDLIGFAEKCKLDNPFQISIIKRYISKTIDCSNGENLKFGTYLNHAGIALKMAKNTVEASSRHSNILKELIRIGDLEEVKNSPRDVTYYNNPENVRQDLNDLVKRRGLDNVFKIFVAERNLAQIIGCSNGEKVRFRIYLANAALALGMANTSRDAHHILSSIIERLVLIAGYEIRDENYYRNSRNLRKDLENITQNCRLDHPTQLTATYNFLNTNMKCANGEELTFRAYLSQMGITLGMAGSSNESISIRFEILDELLNIAGYV